MSNRMNKLAGLVLAVTFAMTSAFAQDQMGKDQMAKGHMAKMMEHKSSPFTGDRKSTRLNSSHIQKSRMPSSA